MSDPNFHEPPASSNVPELDQSNEPVEETPAVDVAWIEPASASEVIDTIFPIPLLDWSATAEPVVVTAEPSLERLQAVEDRLEALVESLNQRFDGLQQLFEREVRAETTREKVVDRLHAELQEYKQDMLLSALRPVFIDLIQLHDDVGKMLEAAKPDEPVEPMRFRQVLEGIQQGLEDVLERQGVESFSAEGTTFDPSRQRILKTVATDQPEQNKVVASRLRKGFQTDSRVLRREMVAVFTYRSPE